MDLEGLFQRMERVEGWFSLDEAELLAEALARSMAELAEGELVEVGSYCGRSTLVLGSVAQALRGEAARLKAIDPHLGEVTFEGASHRATPTLDRFNETIRGGGLADTVELVRARSTEVAADFPIAFIFIDGLHDYASVMGDFRHFEPQLLPGATVAFHDYGGAHVDVKRCVDELVASGALAFAERRDSLAVLRRPPAQPRKTVGRAFALVAQLRAGALARARQAEERAVQALREERERAALAERAAEESLRSSTHLETALQEMASSSAVRGARLLRQLSPRGNQLAAGVVNRVLALLGRK